MKDIIGEIRSTAWIEVDLNNLAHNINEVRRIIPNRSKIAAIIKADAYGHDAIEIARTLLDNEADLLAVANIDEALSLRREFKDVDILILGYINDDRFEEVVSSGLIPTIYQYNQAEELNRIAGRCNLINRIHIKIDSGMNRLGFAINEDTVETIKKISQMENVECEGIYTHLANADAKDKSYTFFQLENFDFLLRRVKEEGLVIPVVHASNSPAIIDLPDLNYDMVRPGIMLYGIYPSLDVRTEEVDLKETMSLRARVAHVKKVGKGSKLGYGLTYTAEDDMDVATIPIGYADGYSRRFSNSMKIRIKNTSVRILGKICMDQFMVDVTGLNIKKGDIITVFGKVDEAYSLNELYYENKIIPQEILTTMHKRLPRVYIKDGGVVKVKTYI